MEVPPSAGSGEVASKSEVQGSISLSNRTSLRCLSLGRCYFSVPVSRASRQWELVALASSHYFNEE
jgi:hypothetical protein